MCDSYTPTYAYASIEERHAVHLTYHFECLCQACRESWPLKSDVPSAVAVDLPLTAFRNGKRPDKRELQRLKQLVKKARMKNSSATVKRDNLTLWSDVLILAYDILQPPHQLLIDAEEKLHEALWGISGGIESFD